MTGHPGDTSAATIARGEGATAGGWRDLVAAGGEVRPQAPKGRVLATLWHLSDLHICDSESPGRIEYLDRYSDPDSPYRAELGDIGTYRPQEALTVQVATMMIRTINEWGSAPATGAPIDAVLLTGDLTDNAQRNELAWYTRIVEGGVVAPRSGDAERSSWVGATDANTWDERYWHPDGPPAGTAPDRPTRVYDYPVIPGLVDAVRRDVVSPGLRLPWISVHGNHDALLQGTVAPDGRLREQVVGRERIVGLPSDATPSLTAEAIPGNGPARYIDNSTSPRISITPDPQRQYLDADEFARTTRDGGPKYFTVDVGELRFIVLDTVNPHGGWQGSLDQTQFAWLENELKRATNRHVVIASHHPSPTLTNDFAPAGAVPRVLGPLVVDLLLRQGNVIAWIAGHVHHHAAGYHGDERRGFWEITTSSLIDWPQQARILEFVEVAGPGSGIAIVSTVVNHNSPASWSADDLDDIANLAAISRTLAANDYHFRDGEPRGIRLDSSPEVRNVVWRLPNPLV